MLLNLQTSRAIIRFNSYEWMKIWFGFCLWKKIHTARGRLKKNRDIVRIIKDNCYHMLLSVFVKVTHVRRDNSTALPPLSSSPHCSLWASDVCRRACFWIEWLQSGTCSVLERIDFVIQEKSKFREKKGEKNAFEMHARLHGSIANPVSIIYQKFNVIMQLLVSHIFILLNTFCFLFCISILHS